LRCPECQARDREILEAARTGVAQHRQHDAGGRQLVIGREIPSRRSKAERRSGLRDNLLRITSKLAVDFGPVTPAPTCAGSGNSYVNTGTCRERFVTQWRDNPTPPGAQADLQFDHAWVANLLGLGSVGDFLQCVKILATRAASPESLLDALPHLVARRKAAGPGFYDRGHSEQLGAVNWNARINSLLYERLALSKNKKGLMRLARKGHEIATPADVSKTLCDRNSWACPNPTGCGIQAGGSPH